MWLHGSIRNVLYTQAYPICLSSSNIQETFVWRPKMRILVFFSLTIEFWYCCTLFRLGRPPTAAEVPDLMLLLQWIPYKLLRISLQHGHSARVDPHRSRVNQPIKNFRYCFFYCDMATSTSVTTTNSTIITGVCYWRNWYCFLLFPPFLFSAFYIALSLKKRGF